MLQKPSVNTDLIMRVIESIKDDPEFNMATWTHCVCGHVHKVTNSNCPSDDTLTALDALGLSRNHANTLFGSGPHKTREKVLEQLHTLATTGELVSI